MSFFLEVLTFLGTCLFICIQGFAFSRLLSLSPILSISVGILVTTYFTYILGSFFQQTIKFSFILINVFTLILSGIFGKKNNSNPPVSAYLFFIGLWFLLAVYQSFSPEIHWGEKFGEYGILSFLTTYNKLPALDPFAYPNNLHYYYFHYLFWAAITSSFNFDPAVIFNLAVCFVPAYVFCLVFEMFQYLGYDFRKSLIASLLIFLPNLYAVKLLYSEGFKINFNQFWETTRFFEYPLFSEYPIWAFIFGDFHPHYMNYITIVSAIFLFSKVVLHKSKRSFLLLGFLTGVTYGFNAWDFVIMIVTDIVATIYFLTSQNKFKITPLFVNLLLLFGVFLTIHPALRGSSALGSGFIHLAQAKVPLQQSLFHYGLFYSIALFFIIKSFGIWKTLAIFFISVLASFVKLNEPGFFGVQFSNFMFLSFLFYLFRTDEKLMRLGGSIFLIGILISLIPNYFTLIDEMNTFFKFNSSAWFFVSIGSSFFIFNLNKYLQFLFKAVFILFSFASLALIWNMAHPLYVKSPQYTLKGDLFLLTDDRFSDDGKAVFWMKKMINSGQIKFGAVLEAPGESYTDSSYFSIFSGLPSVLGWAYQAQVRGTSVADISKRKNLIEAFFKEPDDQKLEELIRLFGIRYVFFGKIELQKYGDELLISTPSKLVQIYKMGQTRIFKALD